LEPPPDTFAIYCMMNLAATVFPAPLSPLARSRKRGEGEKNEEDNVCHFCKENEDPLPDDDTLVLELNQHVAVHVVCESPHMRRILVRGLHIGWYSTVTFHGYLAG